METASITIKLKGAKALQVLNGKSVVTVAKLKGAGLALSPVAKVAAVPAAELEATRFVGNVVTTTEIEGAPVAVATGKAQAGAKAVSGRAFAAKGALAKPGSAAGKVVAAKASAAQAMQSGASSAAANVPVLKAVGASKSAAVTAGKAATGTIWSGTGLSLGLGLGLGAIGPAVLLGALGLTATGIYLYRRNRQVEFQPEGSGLDGVLVDTADQ